MKKTLLTLALAGTIFGIGNNVFSQNIKQISPKKIKSVEILPTKGFYNDRIKKINSLMYKDYEDMLSEVKDIRDTEIYCTKMLKKLPNANILDREIYGERDYWASFKESYSKGFGDCDDGAIAAASLLYDDGFPPYFLLLNGKRQSHIVFLYKSKEKKFGTIGISDIDCIRPTHKNLSKVLKKFEKGLNDKFKHKVLDASAIFPQAIHSEGINYDEF